jgi:hypothetical protein
LVTGSVSIVIALIFNFASFARLEMTFSQSFLPHVYIYPAAFFALLGVLLIFLGLRTLWRSLLSAIPSSHLKGVCPYSPGKASHPPDHAPGLDDWPYINKLGGRQNLYRLSINPLPDHVETKKMITNGQEFDRKAL